MFPKDSAVGERVFRSRDVAQLAGITLRQLQWWDERKVIAAHIQDHRRVYTPEQVLEILTLAALRRKGLSLQKLRRVLRLLRRELERRGSDVWSGKSPLYLLTDGKFIFFDDEPAAVLNRLTSATKPMYLVSVSDQLSRVMAESAPRRYRTKQLQLF